MALKISQKRIDFFSMLSKSGNLHQSESGKRMLRIIEEIDKIFPETEIIAVSSHENLILFSPSDEFNWIVFISSYPKYLIKYKLSHEEKPLGEANVYVEVDSLEEFKNYLIKAMVKSKAWIDSYELQNLYQSFRD